MKTPISLCLLALVGACADQPKIPQNLLDAGVAAAPDVITSPAAVVFWLKDVDTLQADSAVAAVELVTSEAQDLSDLLSDTDVSVYFTTARRIYVRAPLAPRRIVTLAGLDYPWGVVLVDPGYAEQIITGPVAPTDLRELIIDYFGFEDEKPSGPIALSESASQRFSDWVHWVGSGSLVHEITDYTDVRRLLTPGAAIARRNGSQLCFL